MTNLYEEPEFETLEFPERLTLELTNDCNLSCVMCPRREMEKGTGYMDIELFRKIIAEASGQLPVTLVPFFRGESLLHPDFLTMLKEAKQAGLGPVQLTTNAMLLDEGLSLGILEAGLDFISFSLDVLGKGNYERMRRGGDYELVTSNIDGFLGLRKKLRLARPTVQVSSVETEENSAMLDDFVDYWSEKVERVRIYPEHSKDGSFGSLGERFELPEFERRLPCRKVFTDMVVYFNGEVAVCNHDWARSEFIGNARDATIREIWHSEKYEEIRENHRLGMLDADPTCSGCDHWKMYYVDEGRIGALYEEDAI